MSDSAEGARDERPVRNDASDASRTSATRTVAGGSLPRFKYQMPNLGHNEFLHGELHGRHGAWHGENDDPVTNSADCAAEHRRRADLVVAEHAKQLAVTGHRFR